jgi:hypothetical protein
MAEFDPVPVERLLPIEVAERYIDPRFASDGTCTPRDLSLQVLVDDTRASLPELRLFQNAGRGDVNNFFRFMRTVIDDGMGRHTQHVLAAACLHPNRDSPINLASAATVYLEAHGSMVDDMTMARAWLGTLEMDALLNSKKNEELVRVGELRYPTGM